LRRRNPSVEGTFILIGPVNRRTPLRNSLKA
jgi:hypothetical protein